MEGTFWAFLPAIVAIAIGNAFLLYIALLMSFI